MPRRAVRELQQLLAGGERRQPPPGHPSRPHPQPTHQPPPPQQPPSLQRRRGGGSNASTAAANPDDGCEDRLLRVCHRLQQSRYSFYLAVLLAILVVIAFRELLLGSGDYPGEIDDDNISARDSAAAVSRNHPAAPILEKALQMKRYQKDPVLDKALQMKEYAEKTNAIKKGKKDELSMRPSVLDSLRSLPDFPKIVHLVWPDKEILSKDFEMLHHGAARLRDLNPDWRFAVHDYADVDAAIRTFRHPDIPAECTEQLANAYIVEKTDAFRLIKVYLEGGLYTDIDRVMNANLNEAIDVKTVKMASPTHYDVNFSCDLFGSSPGNPLILRAFQRQCEERAAFPRRKGWIKPSDQMKLVRAFTASMEVGFFGRTIDSESPLWNEARRVLSTKSEGMIVTKKDIWCDGLLVSDYEGCKEVSRDSLYDAYGVGEWADAVNEVWKGKVR